MQDQVSAALKWGLQLYILGEFQINVSDTAHFFKGWTVEKKGETAKFRQKRRLHLIGAMVIVLERSVYLISQSVRWQ